MAFVWRNQVVEERLSVSEGGVFIPSRAQRHPKTIKSACENFDMSDAFFDVPLCTIFYVCQHFSKLQAQGWTGKWMFSEIGVLLVERLFEARSPLMPGVYRLRWRSPNLLSRI